MLWRISAVVAHESSIRRPRSRHSSTLDSPICGAARCRSAWRDLPRAARISCHVVERDERIAELHGCPLWIIHLVRQRGHPGRV